MKSRKVIIIGGGIGGLTTAIGLRKSGLDVRIYERKREHTEVGAAIILWPNALLALDAMGAAKPIIERHETLDVGMSQTFKGEPLARIPMSELREKLGMPAMVMHRGDLQQRLLEQVNPEQLTTDHKCTRFEQDAEGATVFFANGASDRADLVVVAEGPGSVLRKQMFPNESLIYTGRTSWRGCVYGLSETPLPRNTFIETQGRGARVGMGYLGEGRIGWWANLTIPEREAEAIGPPKDRLLREFTSWPHPIGAVITATKESDMVLTKIQRFASRSTWSQGRVTLMGDAAHAMSPDLGQGGCQAIEDAAVLGDCLTREENVLSALASYERRRIPRANKIVDRSALVGKVSNWKHPFLCWMRSRLIKSMSGDRALKQLADMLAFDPSAP